MQRTNRDTAADMILGALAGAVGTLAMGHASTAIYDRHDRATLRREILARGGTNTHAIAARKAARLAGTELSDEQAAMVGTAMHYGVGMGTAALYGAARPHLPLPSPVRGLAFGATVWLLGDEVGNAAAGITPGPGAFPWQTHARGLAAHLAFGLVTEGVLSAIDWARARAGTGSQQPGEWEGGPGRETGDRVDWASIG